MEFSIYHSQLRFTNTTSHVVPTLNLLNNVIIFDLPKSTLDLLARQILDPFALLISFQFVLLFYDVVVILNLCGMIVPS